MEKYIVDIVLVLIFLAFTIAYSSRGFSKTVLKFVSFILAIVLSKSFSGQVTSWALNNTKFFADMSRQLAGMIVFVLMFVALLIVLKWLSSLVGKVFKLPVLKQADKILGAVFGAVNGLIVVLILCVCLKISSGMVYNARYLNAVNNSVIVQTVLPDNKLSDGFTLKNGGK